MTDVERIKRELKSRANKPQAAILRRFFKTAPGEYGAGDVFLGLPVPLQRRIALKYGDLSLAGIKELLASPIHESRLVGLLILVEQYAAAKEEKIKKNIVDFYLKNTRAINNWDLVDLSVYKILGDWFLNNDRAVLIKLAESKNLWERRMAMVATFAFIRAGRIEETFLIAKKLLRDEHDLIHKAVGWMLREAGKRVSEPALLKFLDEHAGSMPRTALRYAIERLTPRHRERYLAK